MKNNWVVLTLVLAVLGGCATVPEPPEALVLEDHWLTAAFAQLDELLFQPGESAASLRSVYLPVRQRLVDGSLSVHEEILESADFVDGVLFSANIEEERYEILVSAQVLEASEKYPSLLLSSLMMEIHEAYQFFEDREVYLASGKTSLAMEEAFLRSRRGQAEFIERILKPAGYELVPFEEFLAETWVENDMSAYLTLFRGLDQETLREMQRVLSQLKTADQVQLLSLIQERTARARELRENFSITPGVDVMDNYRALVPSATFLSFIQQFQMDVWQRLEKMGEEEKSPLLEAYQQLDLEINQLNQKMFGHMELYVESFRSIIDHYGAALPAEDNRD